jgi:hypothetical protein
MRLSWTAIGTDRRPLRVTQKCFEIWLLRFLVLFTSVRRRRAQDEASSDRRRVGRDTPKYNMSMKLKRRKSAMATTAGNYSNWMIIITTVPPIEVMYIRMTYTLYQNINLYRQEVKDPHLGVLKSWRLRCTHEVSYGVHTIVPSGGLSGGRSGKVFTRWCCPVDSPSEGQADITIVWTLDVRVRVTCRVRDIKHVLYRTRHRTEHRVNTIPDGPTNYANFSCNLNF